MVQCRTFYNRLGKLITDKDKRDITDSVAMKWVRKKMSFGLLRHAYYIYMDKKVWIKIYPWLKI